MIIFNLKTSPQPEYVHWVVQSHLLRLNLPRPFCSIITTPLSLSNNPSKAAVHGLYISPPCRQTADVRRFEAKKGWLRVGKFDFANKLLLGNIVIVKWWHRNVIPLFYPLLSRGNSISQSQAIDNNAITSNYETRTPFSFFLRHLVI